jgi:O-antigen/teichoic acid export membrane protein
MLARILKNGVFLVAAGLIDKLAYLVLVTVIARGLTSPEFAAYNLVLTLLFIGGAAVTFGMETVDVREVAKHREASSAIWTNALPPVLFFSLVAWPGAVCAAVALHYGREVVSLLAFAGAAFLFMGVGQTAVAVIKAHERMEILVLVGFCASVASLGLNIGALWLGRSLPALVAIIVIIEGMKAFFFAAVVHRRFAPICRGLDRALAARLFRLTLPFTMLMAYGALAHRVDLLIMARLRPMEEVAVYGAATRFTDFLSFLGGSLAAGLYPVLSSKVASGRDSVWRLFNESIGIFALLGFGAAMAVTLLAGPMIAFLFGGRYLEGAEALRWLGWSFLFTVLSGPVGMLLLAADDMINRLLVLSVILLCCSVGLNLWLIPGSGGTGAAIAALLTAILGFAGRMFLSRAYFGRLPRLAIVWRALAASACMGLFLAALPGLHLFVRLALGGSAYVAALTLLGEFRQARYAPFREKIGRLFAGGPEASA